MSDDDTLIEALRKLPQPVPRPGFIDEALARAVGTPRPAPPPRALARPETWIAAVMGAAIAAATTWFILAPTTVPQHGTGIALALHESRNIDVLVESERELRDATIRVTLTGSVVLDGFEDEQQIDWHADLERGANLLSLPVTARSTGAGRLVAVIEHGGRTRAVTVDLTVNDRQGRS